MAAKTRAMTGPWVICARSAGNRRFDRALRALGYRVHGLAAVRLEPLIDQSALETCLMRLTDYRWLVFTSPQAVAPALSRLPRDPQTWPPIACVGRQTAARVAECGGRAQLVSTGGGAELARRLCTVTAAGAAVLHPCGDQARPELAAVLHQAGHRVDEPVVYRSVVLNAEDPRLKTRLPAVRGVAVTSPLCWQGLVRALGRAAPTFLGTVPIVCLGRTTAERVRADGFPAAVAREPDARGLAERVAEVLQGGEQHGLS